MSKFRARQLDASKPISIFLQEDISDYNEFNNVTNRTVPQLPTGMEKEEETEHHLQQAIFHQRVIPVPEVYDTTEDAEDSEYYNLLYPPTYKFPRQMIHIHPFSADQDIPDYDLDSEDEGWLQQHATKSDLLPLQPLQFEEMMDRLEKASGLKAVTLQEAKLLLRDDDDLITEVYDYWLNKRLSLQQALIPQVGGNHGVKMEKSSGSTPNDPYIAFRKRTEKMQTRKNRKNDETSYEKMLKLRRDLTRAVTLLEMIKRREKSKRELLHLNIEVFEKRYECEDFSGNVLNEVMSSRVHLQRPAFTPLAVNHQMEYAEEHSNKANWNKNNTHKEEGKREKRHYKKKKKSHSQLLTSTSAFASPFPHPAEHFTFSSAFSQESLSSVGASEEEGGASPCQSEAEDDLLLDGEFTFHRKPHVIYQAPVDLDSSMSSEGVRVLPCTGGEVPSSQYSLVSLRHPRQRWVGLSRRRLGRGGRILLDRMSPPRGDDSFSSHLFEDHGKEKLDQLDLINKWPHYHPSSPPPCDISMEDSDAEVDVETIGGGGALHAGIKVGSPAQGAPEEPNCPSPVPSSFYLTAEVLQGMHEGSVTQLHVALPTDGGGNATHGGGIIGGESTSSSCTLPTSPPPDNQSLLVEDSNHLDEVDILSTDTHTTTTITSTNTSGNNSGAGPPFKSQQQHLSKSYSFSVSGSSANSGVMGRQQQSGSDESLSTRVTTSATSLVGSRRNANPRHSNHAHQYKHKHSSDFHTQPSSKFVTVDANCQLGGQWQSFGNTTAYLAEELHARLSPPSSPSPTPPHYSSTQATTSSCTSTLSHDNYDSQSSCTVSQFSCTSSLSSSSSCTVSPSSNSSLLCVSSNASLSNNSSSCPPHSSTSSSGITKLESILQQRDLTSCSSPNASKKLSNSLSSKQQQPKDNNTVVVLDSIQISSATSNSSFVLSNSNKNNNSTNISSSTGNDAKLLGNSNNSHLISQKIISSSWTTDAVGKVEGKSSLLSNGPSKNSLDNSQSTTKISPISVPET